MTGSDALLPLVGHPSISSLTWLHLDQIAEPNFILQLLQQLPTLEHLWLECTCVSTNPFTPLPLSLPFLLSMNISCDMPSLLALLVDPRLAS